MEDLVNIHISQSATNVAERFKNEFFFRDALTVAKFAMAYMLLNCEEKDIEWWLKLTERKDPDFDSTGNNYNVGSLDKDNKLAKIITAKYPYCDTPYRYIRVLMNKGLLELGEKIKSFDDFLEFLKLLPSTEQ